MARARLTVKAELLKWARETAGMAVEVAAAKIGITEERLRRWEAEGGDPTPRMLERVAEVYKRSPATFFLPARPVEPALPIDFRSPMPGPSASERLSPEVLFALRRARRLQAASAEIADGAATLPRLTLDQNPGQLAQQARAALGINLQDQMTFRTANKALAVWRRALEATGVLVFNFPIPSRDVRAFSLAGTPPVIVLSGDDYRSSQIFSLFHEWAHLGLGEPGICLPDVEPRTAGASRVELFCNQFAADFLVPTEALLDEEATSDIRARRITIADALLVLARVFAVSRYVILRRLRTLHLISDAEFRRTDRALADEFRKELDKRERDRQRAKEAGEKFWGVPPPVKVVRELGRAFVHQVLDARERGAIHDADMADLLAVRLKHLPRIAELVGAA